MIGKWCVANNMLRKKELVKSLSVAKRKETVDVSVKATCPKNNDKQWILETISRIKAQWKKQDEKINTILKMIDHILQKLIRFILKMVIFGIICNIIASSFWPEFPKEHPAIFGWFDGWLQFGEYVYRALFKGIYAILTGNFKGFKIEFVEEFKELFKQFVNWISMLKL